MARYRGCQIVDVIVVNGTPMMFLCDEPGVSVAELGTAGGASVWVTVCARHGPQGQQDIGRKVITAPVMPPLPPNRHH